MELRQYALILWRWWWLILLAIVLAGATAFWTSRSLAPVYASSTLLLVNQAPATASGPDYTALLTSERLARSYAEMMRSREILGEVIDILQLDMRTQDLAKQITVNVIRDTQLLRVTVEDTNPQRAADIANLVVDAFVRHNLALQSSRYRTSKESLQRELAQLQTVLAQTQASLNDLGSPTTAEQEAERQRLEALQAQYRNSYTGLLNSYEQIRLAEAQSTNNVNVLERAEPVPEPIRPRVLLNTLLAGVVGAMLALGVVFLLEYMDDSVKTSHDVEQLTGRPALGAITRFDEGEADTLVVRSAPRSLAAEAYKVLRANIKFSAVDQPLRSVLVTSGSPVEGKSTTVANLAAATAQAGKRVILVDTDLRRPTQHKLFGVPNALGFTTAVLQEHNSLEDCIAPTAVENLYLLPSGPLPPNPSELLGSQRMLELLEELKERADVVFFDSPPVLGMADAALLARICDATLLVAEAGGTRSEVLLSALDQLEKSGSRVLGVILNRVSLERGSYYYYHYRFDYTSHDQEGRNGWRPQWGRLVPFLNSRQAHSNSHHSPAHTVPADRPGSETG